MDIIGYLPEYMKEYEEIKEISCAESPEFRTATSGILQLPYEFYAETAGEKGIERFEALLGINPSAEESLDYRRFRIKTKLTENKQDLTAVLNSIIPDGGLSVEYDEQSFKLSVRVSLANQRYMEDVIQLLDKLLPANMEIECSMLYSTHGSLSRYSHSQLAEYTHDSLRYYID